MTFSIRIKKEIINSKITEYKAKKLQIMSSLLSSLVDNLLYKNECKDCEYCLNCEIISDKALQFTCPDRNKSYKKDFDEKYLQILKK